MKKVMLFVAILGASHADAGFEVHSTPGNDSWVPVSTAEHAIEYVFPVQSGHDVIQPCLDSNDLEHSLKFTETPLAAVIINRIQHDLIVSQQSSYLTDSVTLRDFFRADRHHPVRYIVGQHGDVIDLQAMALPIHFGEPTDDHLGAGDPNVIYSSPGYNDTFTQNKVGVMMGGAGYNFFIIKSLHRFTMIIVDDAGSKQETDTIVFQREPEPFDIGQQHGEADFRLMRYQDSLVMMPSRSAETDVTAAEAHQRVIFNSGLLLNNWYQTDNPNVRYIQLEDGTIIDLMAVDVDEFYTASSALEIME